MGKKSQVAWLETLVERLESAARKGHLRNLPNPNSGLVDFYSNDYLAIAREVTKSGLNETLHGGSTGSRLLSGNHERHVQLESFLAHFHRSESGLLFGSGYLANLGVMSSLPLKGDLVLYDELSHACIKDGIRLSMADRFPFRHNDMNDLEGKLKRFNHKRKFIVFESVYSMDGDVCPLKELVSLAQKYDAFLIVDEAHSTGIFGPRGEGLAVELGVQDEIHVRIHTFGKAIGSHGAVVLGNKKLIEFLVNYSRPFIFTTAISVNQVAHIENAYAKLDESRLEKWEKKAKFFASTFFKPHTKSPIYPIVLGDGDKAKFVSESLKAAGFDVKPILSPTVKKGSERLRICLHLHNSDDEILALRDSLKNIMSDL